MDHIRPVETTSSDQPPVRKIAYNYREACDALGIAKTTLYDLVAERRLTPVKMGRINLFLAEDIAAFVASLPKRGPGVMNGRRAA